MTTLRNIWSDLVEKRLWPVAVLLLAGLIAVPLVLARGAGEDSDSNSASAVAVTARADTTGPEIVTLDVAPQVKRHDGRGRDPFAQPKSAKAAKAPALPSGATADGGGGGEPASPAAGSDSTKSTKPVPAKRVATGPTYTVDLRFGQADSMKTLRDVARLTPLPSASSPFFVFLGAKSDGKTLVFLVSSDAKATGDGTCRPSSKECETIELGAGDTEFFDLASTDGVQQYQMDIVKINRSGGASKSSSGKVARSARAKASKADRRLLRKVLAGRASHLMGSYRWVPRRGVLVHVPAWSRDQAQGPAEDAGTGPAPSGTSAD